MSSIAIEPMLVTDLEEVHVMEVQHQPQPWSRSMFETEVAGVDRHYLVARVDGRLVGFGGAMVVDDEAHVMNLLVDPAWRRRGIGAALFAALIERAVEAGARHVTLEVRSRNEPAISFYGSVGLAPVGVRPGYYHDDDALIMWSHDIDLPVEQEVAS